MKETGLPFKAEMVCAILDGRKTQTRRIVKGQEFWGAAAVQAHQMDSGVWRIEGAKQINAKLHDNAVTFVDVKCPFGKVGDRIWVRETWQHSNYPYGPFDKSCDVFYRADYLNDVHGPDGELSPEGRYRFWNPSIHMPRAASRILLEITDIRIERLQEISVEDAEAEGCKAPHALVMELGCRASPQIFADVWQSTGGDWDANPWVWVIEFQKLGTGAT